MEDNKIIDLYFQRDEAAIAETAGKYGAYCMKICMNILHDLPDSEECVNDTYLNAWNAMPPHRPALLSAFLGRISRNLALNRYKAQHAEKRAGGEFAVSLEELAECVPDPRAPEGDARELGRLISRFLHGQPEVARRVFVCRYFYCDSVAEIAQRFGHSQSKVKSLLFRTRKRLKQYLESEGTAV